MDANPSDRRAAVAFWLSMIAVLLSLAPWLAFLSAKWFLSLNLRDATTEWMIVVEFFGIVSSPFLATIVGLVSLLFKPNGRAGVAVALGVLDIVSMGIGLWLLMEWFASLPDK